MSRKIRLTAGALIVVSVGAFALSRLVGGTERAGEEREELVYYPLVTNGFEYQRVPYPVEVETIRILAGEPVALEARRSLVSFWPITREYLADFAKLDEPVAGSAEVIDQSGTVTTVEPRVYTLWYPEGLFAEGQLVAGDEAQQTYDTYVAEARAAFEADRQYQMRVARLQAEIDEWLALAAEGVEPLPDPPAELTEPRPERYRAYASEPAVAPVVALPVGSYTLRWRGLDGEIVPGSERKLVSFDSTRTGVSYTIIPYDRWTQPIFSFDPEEAIYLAAEQDIFLAPLHSSRFNSYLYSRVFEPQTIEAPERTAALWVPDDADPDLTGYRLRAWQEGEQAGELPWLGYRVYQVPGATRGYTIEQFDEPGALQPDFMAMRLPVDQSVTAISLLGPDGGEVTNSRRDLRRVPTVPRVMLYLPAVAFLGVAASLHFVRGRRET